MYKDTVTVYNRYNGVWKGEVLRYVDLNADRAAIVAKYGADSKDRAKLHIRYTVNASVYICGDKTYVEPSAYTGVSGTFTLASGNNATFFVEGDTGLYSAADSAYVDGFYDYANRTWDKCYSVTSAARYSVIPHFEVMGQ